MSYDVYLRDPVSQDTVELPDAHHMTGGTYAIGGTREAWLNITWNYSSHYYRVFGESGLRTIYGLTGADSIPVLEAAATRLGDETSDNYWEPTEGNAKRPLLQLIALAKLRPDGVWDGD